MGPTALSRRELLAFAGLSAGVLALAGCRDSVDDAPAEDATSPAGSADLALARRTGRRAAALVGALASAASDHRELRELLRSLLARHREHVRAFAPESRIRQFPTPVLPNTAAAALGGLGKLEREAAFATRDAALRASSGELASALASAAACMEQHVDLLESARDDLRGRS